MTLDGTAGWEGRPFSLLGCGSPSWEEGVGGAHTLGKEEVVTGELKPWPGSLPAFSPWGSAPSPRTWWQRGQGHKSAAPWVRQVCF